MTVTVSGRWRGPYPPVEGRALRLQVGRGGTRLRPARAELRRVSNGKNVSRKRHRKEGIAMPADNRSEQHELYLERLHGSNAQLFDSFPNQVAATPRFLPAKLAAMGLVREIAEMSDATGVLVSSRTPRAAYATARGAFEAFQDLLYLIYGPTPDLAGACAFVAGLVDNRSSWNKGEAAAAALAGRPAIPMAETSVDNVVAEEAAFLDAHEPAAGQILWDALERVRKHRDRRRSHWSGLRRNELAQVLNDIIGNKASQAANKRVMISLYDLLSRQTHAAPRCHPPFLEVDAGFHFVIKPDHAKTLVFTSIAVAACVIAVEGTLKLLSEIENRLSGEE